MNWIRRLFGNDRQGDDGRTRSLAAQLRRTQDKPGQERALSELAEIGTVEAQKVLFKALRDRDLGTLQGQIVYALSRFDIELARPALLKCLVDQDWFVRGVAADAIGDMTTRDSALTGTLVSLLWKASGASIESLSRGLTPGVYTGPEALQVLNNPASQDQFVIIGVMKALGKIRETTAAEPLKKIIARGRLHPDVLYNAEQALAAIAQAEGT